MNVRTFFAAPAAAERFPKVFTVRTFRGVLVGALASVIVCNGLSVMLWQLRLYSPGLNVVWSVPNETAAWRGALLGLLVGWFGRSPRQLLNAIGFGTLALLIYGAQQQLLMRMPLRDIYNIALVAQYVLYTVLVCGFAYLVLMRRDRDVKRRLLAAESAVAETTCEAETAPETTTSLHSRLGTSETA